MIAFIPTIFFLFNWQTGPAAVSDVEITLDLGTIRFPKTEDQGTECFPKTKDQDTERFPKTEDQGTERLS